jgi:pantoate--beta-alanine ligase
MLKRDTFLMHNTASYERMPGLKSLDSVAGLRDTLARWRMAGERVAFVPTMGNLHEGHLALVRRARRQCERVVVSIFVNPMQFGPNEDFDSYPRTYEEDRSRLEREGVDLLFAPPVTVLFPRGLEGTTRIEVPGPSEGLCADFRPGHFTGVATIVAKLFNLVQPDVAIFGEKDYQQLAVIRQMTRDLCWPIDIVGVPTVRETDGLAMSSRNRYLSVEERRVAPTLYRTLCEVAQALGRRERSIQELEAAAIQSLQACGFQPDYIVVRNPDTLRAVLPQDRDAVVLAAARLGKARLIDNVRVKVPEI